MSQLTGRLRTPKRICKPEYLFRPAQIARRLAQGRDRERAAPKNVLLPWGLWIQCSPSDAIGSSIARTGVYDLAVTEAIWRLLDRGGRAMDVGANIGYMTSAMAARVGSRGTVLAIEPHPALVAELTENVAGWRAGSDTARPTILPVALSDRSGESFLEVPGDFESNQGTARLAEREPSRDEGLTRIPVSLRALDDLVGIGSPLDLMKLDVEGHELAVLRGGATLLADRLVGNVVYESLTGYPSPVSGLLEGYGYSILFMSKGLLGLLVAPAEVAPESEASYEPRSYIATKDPDRALARLRPKGWMALRGSVA